CAALLLGVLGVGPALAQANRTEERIALIVSRTPPRTSATYKLLTGAAGSPIVKSLKLTKSEMWSVRKDAVEAVMKAAAQYHVEVRQLGAPRVADGAGRHVRGAVPESAREPNDDWQQIFRVASIDLKVNDKQKHLIEVAKASNAAIGVGVMATPPAPEL